jgi:hypothetical protein
MLIVVGMLTLLLFMILAIVNYLYPVFYLKRIAHGAENIKTDEILGDFKKNAEKLLSYALG